MSTQSKKRKVDEAPDADDSEAIGAGPSQIATVETTFQKGEVWFDDGNLINIVVAQGVGFKVGTPSIYPAHIP